MAVHIPPIPNSNEARLAQKLAALERRITQLELQKVTQAWIGWRGTAQTLVSGFNLIKLDENFGPAGLFSSEGYKVPTEGVYFATGEATWISKSGAVSLALITKNSGEVLRGTRFTAASEQVVGHITAGLIHCGTGDILQLFVYDSVGGGSLDNTNSVDNRLTVFRVA